MSYPKTHPLQSQSALELRSQKQQQKREQIKLMLLNKLRTKFKIQPNMTEQDYAIRDEIDQLMQRETITEAVLQELEKKIKEKLGRFNNPEEVQNDALSRKPLDSRTSGRSSQSQLSKQSKGLRSSQSQRSGLSIKSKNANMDLTEEAWNDILKYNSTMYQMEQEELRRKKEENKQRIKEELARQVAEKKQAKMRELKEETDYFQLQKLKLEEDEKNEKKKQYEMQQKMKSEAQIRASQLEMQNLRRSQEVLNERMLGNQMRLRMEIELKEEQERIKRKLDDFKKQQMNQLQENKRLRDDAVKKEFELDNQPPSGNDLMHALYMEKKHQSYEKRAKQEKILNLMRDQVEGGESNKRIQQEIQAMNNYIKAKEIYDTQNDEFKKKTKKMRELETKRILDIQLEEKRQQERLKKYEGNVDSKWISQDVQSFEETEKQKQDRLKQMTLEHNTKLVKQIEDKKKPAKLDPIEFEMNKQLIMKIQTSKNNFGGSKTQLLSPQQSVSKFNF